MFRGCLCWIFIQWLDCGWSWSAKGFPNVCFTNDNWCFDKVNAHVIFLYVQYSGTGYYYPFKQCSWNLTGLLSIFPFSAQTSMVIRWFAFGKLVAGFISLVIKFRCTVCLLGGSVCVCFLCFLPSLSLLYCVLFSISLLGVSNLIQFMVYRVTFV